VNPVSGGKKRPQNVQMGAKSAPKTTKWGQKVPPHKLELKKCGGKKCRGGPCPDAPLPGVCAEQLHLQLVGAVAGRCAGPLCDRAGPLVRQRKKDRPV